MRQAAVGFQCPSCVNEGAKSTRSGRTAYGGTRSANPALTSQILIGLNVLVWLLITATGGAASQWVDRLALLPDGAVFRLPDGTLMPVEGVSDGAYWQLLTSMFTHVDLLHIGFNMLALWFLGPQLEAAIGRSRFLALYFVSGMVGSAFVYWLAPIHTSTVGASGAIFGLMGALLIIAIKVGADYSPILMWLGLNVVLTVVGRGFISWQGHLGGLVGGVLVALVIAYSPRKQRSLWQGIGIGALSVLVLAAFVARTLALV
ncbi:MAG TPA: rhomboid family intramembrane serine protease [Nocardioidaceae bacterium]|nr:rhomboid family intramembrane serine protease [Nocardioidaceae bacterium]